MAFVTFAGWIWRAAKTCAVLDCWFWDNITQFTRSTQWYTINDQHTYANRHIHVDKIVVRVASQRRIRHAEPGSNVGIEAICVWLTLKQIRSNSVPALLPYDTVCAQSMQATPAITNDSPNATAGNVIQHTYLPGRSAQSLDFSWV